MVGFIDAHRDAHGVEPICDALPIDPSTYYDHVETINGRFKAEVIHRRGAWRGFEAVEYATLERVDWFNNRPCLSPAGRSCSQ